MIRSDSARASRKPASHPVISEGFFRSSDGGASWDKIAGQYLPDDYVFGNVKDIDGDKTTEGKLYMILGKTTLAYGVYAP